MNILSVFTGSFHSAAIYREVRKNGGFYMGYALLVVVITCLLVTMYFTGYVHREIFSARDGKAPFFDDMVRQITTQLPVMTLKNHVLSSSETTPTIIRLSGTAFGLTFENVEAITIDTSGNTTYETMKTPMLITAHDVVMKSENKTEIKSIAELTKDAPETMVLNRAMLDDLANTVITAVHQNLLSFYLVFGGITLFLVIIYMYVMRIIMLLLLGLAGLAIGSMLKTKLKYDTAVALASVSYTPIALLDAVLFALMHYPTSKMVLFLAGCVALFVAIKCSDSPNTTPVVT